MHEATPEYAAGFWDAAQAEPLFSDAHPAYAAGWNAYWQCRELFAAAFSQ